MINLREWCSRHLKWTGLRFASTEDALSSDMPEPIPTPEEKAEAAKERDDAHASANKDQEEYDKQLLTLSVGVLAIILGFIKDLVKVPSAVHWWMFPTACCLFFGCVLSVLFSYQYSIYVNRRISLHHAYKMEGRGKEKPYPYSRAELIKWINISSGTLFFLGILCTGLFVLKNLQQERRMSNPSNLNEGQFSKSIPSLPNQEERGQFGKAVVPPAPKPQQTSTPSQKEK